MHEVVSEIQLEMDEDQQMKLHNNIIDGSETM
jgi:hypothetical protein